MTNITAIIEARCNSKRLPNKVLLKIKNKPIIYHLIQRLKESKKLNTIIVATTKNKSDDKLVNYLKKRKIAYYRGSENNVRNRVLNAAIHFKSDIIVQITGDCPLIDPYIVDKVISTYQRKNVKCCSNSFVRSYPDGMDVVVFSLDTLKKIDRLCPNQKKYKEHTSLYFLRNLNKRSKFNIVAPKNTFFPNLGLTLDEKNDFILIKKIFNYFFRIKKNYKFRCYEIINLLRSRPDYLRINEDVKRKKIPV